jgi:hypothetical protein
MKEFLCPCFDVGGPCFSTSGVLSLKIKNVFMLKVQMELVITIYSLDVAYTTCFHYTLECDVFYSPFYHETI